MGAGETPSDVWRRRLSITPGTLVPIGLVAAAFALGFGIKSADASREASAAAVMSEMDKKIDRLLVKVDLLAQATSELKVVSYTRSENESQWKLFAALNPTILVPGNR